MNNTNQDQLKLIADLTNVHAGQYLALVDGESLKIVQVQESNVADSYNLEPVDIENITLDLSDNYELLQILVQKATAEKLDLSDLIIKWLKEYPTISEELTEAQNLADEKDKVLNDNAEQIQTLESENQQLESKNQQLEKELADLKQAKPNESDTKSDDQPTKDGSNTTVASDQPVNKD